MNILSGEAASAGESSPGEEFVERLLELQPRLQRALQVQLPSEISARLGSVTPHQLEALGRLPREGTTMRDFANGVGISGAAATAMAGLAALPARGKAHAVNRFLELGRPVARPHILG